MHVCTIVNRTRLPEAIVLARGVRVHARDPVTIVVVGEHPSPPPEEGVHIRSAAEMGVEQLEALAMRHAPHALPRALVPFVLRRLLDEGADTAVHLAPGWRATGPLSPIADALAGADVVLVPRLTELPADDGRRPTAGEILRDGTIHPGVIAVGRGPAATAVLDRWPRFLVEPDPAEREREIDVLQAWLDALPATVDGVAVLRDAGVGAAPWNLDGRPLSLREGRLHAGDRPLALIDLGALDPHRSHVLGAHQERLRLSEAPILADLCTQHARELLEAGYDQARAAPVPFAALPDGTAPDARMRRLFANGVDAGELEASPFSDAGQDAFYAWLNEPAASGRGAGLTRYHLAMWTDTLELRAAYPDLDGPDGAGFAGWLCVHGAERFALTEALLPPRPPHVHDIPRPAGAEAPWGVNVAGFFTAELGVGEAARLVIAGLDAAGVSALPVQGALMPPSRRAAEFAFATPDEAPFPINLVCMNGDSIPVFAREAGRRFFAGRYSIALWWWEAGEIPESWYDAFDHLDEVWVAAEHTYRAIAPVSPVPVVKVPLPVTAPPIPQRTRAQLGLPEEPFVFLYVYDYHSTAARKNPVGHVEAFKRAFPEPGEAAALVLKCLNSASAPSDHEAVLLACQGRPDITIIDRYLTAGDKDALIAACDCYLSLHRSEGFGLTPAEAMALGKPVVATRYGGVLEFMTDENSFLVDHTPIDVGPDAHPYPAQAQWADPDLDDAARMMRLVIDDPVEAHRRGLRAAADIGRSNAPEVAGAAMRHRLEAIRARLPRAAPAPRQSALRAAVEHRARDAARTLRSRLGSTPPRADPDTEAHVRELERRLSQASAGRAEALAEARRLRRELDATLAQREGR